MAMRRCACEMYSFTFWGHDPWLANSGRPNNGRRLLRHDRTSIRATMRYIWIERKTGSVKYNDAHA